LLLLLLVLLLQALTLWLQFRSKCNQNEGCYELKMNLTYRLKYGEQKWWWQLSSHSTFVVVVVVIDVTHLLYFSESENIAQLKKNREFEITAVASGNMNQTWL
jgi:hypothetical protein